VEGAAVLANAAGADPARSAAFDAAGIDTAVRAAARRALDDPGVCVVEQALAAAALGATALHDLTEGGLAGGLHELARASGLTVRVDARAVDWFAPGVAVCRALGADPWATLSSGSVLAAFAPDRAAGAVERLTAAGHRRAVIGTLTHPADAGNGHSRVVDLEGRPILEPERDEVARLSAG
jgi:hydrogenase expression/formation protein HypE